MIKGRGIQAIRKDFRRGVQNKKNSTKTKSRAKSGTTRTTRKKSNPKIMTAKITYNKKGN